MQEADPFKQPLSREDGIGIAIVTLLSGTVAAVFFIWARLADPSLTLWTATMIAGSGACLLMFFSFHPAVLARRGNRAYSLTWCAGIVLVGCVTLAGREYGNRVDDAGIRKKGEDLARAILKHRSDTGFFPPALRSIAAEGSTPTDYRDLGLVVKFEYHAPVTEGGDPSLSFRGIDDADYLFDFRGFKNGQPGNPWVKVNNPLD